MIVSRAMRLESIVFAFKREILFLSTPCLPSMAPSTKPVRTRKNDGLFILLGYGKVRGFVAIVLALFRNAVELI